MDRLAHRRENGRLWLYRVDRRLICAGLPDQFDRQVTAPSQWPDHLQHALGVRPTRSRTELFPHICRNVNPDVPMRRDELFAVAE